MLEFILLPLFLTLVLEAFVYFWLRPFSRKVFSVTLVVNVLLNVLLNVTLMYFPLTKSYTGYVVTLIIAEVFIVVVETFIIYKVLAETKIRAFVFALIANTLSLSVGLLFNALQVIKTQTDALIAIIIFFFLFQSQAAFVFLGAYYKDNTDNKSRNKDELDAKGN